MGSRDPFADSTESSEGGRQGRNVETEYVETWYTSDMPPVDRYTVYQSGRRGEAGGDSRKTGFSYGGFYGQYDHEQDRYRPETQYTQDNPPFTPSTAPGTPATAALLPWMNDGGNGDVPPVADLPGGDHALGKQDYPMLEDDGRSGENRGPVAPAMAQTPALGGERGWHGVIPPFR